MAAHFSCMMDHPKLFMVLLGANPKGRVVEQHDYFFGIADNLQQLVPALQSFWPEADTTLHIDGWREINYVEDYQIIVAKKTDANAVADSSKQLFFINLGGYTTDFLEEQHYTMLCVQNNPMDAVKYAKTTPFFKTSSIKSSKGATAHIDEKYGIDVDELYRIEDLLTKDQKENYSIVLKLTTEKYTEDELHLGYLKLNKLKLTGNI